MRRRVRDVERVARQFGSEVEQVYPGHLRFIHPALPPVITSQTPGSAFAMRKLAVDLRRAAPADTENG